MKKLYKSRKSAMIGGVCAGVADYFQIDRNLVRLVAVGAFLLTGGVIVGILYLVAMAILPYDDDIIEG